MARFLVDEDLPRYARRHGAVLVTADLGFSNVLRFPLVRHGGIVVVRFPNEVSTGTLNAAIATALGSLAEDELADCLVIIEPEKIRRRRS